MTLFPYTMLFRSKLTFLSSGVKIKDIKANVILQNKEDLIGHNPSSSGSGSPKVTQFLSLDPDRPIQIRAIRPEMKRTGPL